MSIIRPKRGTSRPTTGNLSPAEIAVDTLAQKLYINDAGTIKEIGGPNLKVVTTGNNTTAEPETHYVVTAAGRVITLPTSPVIGTQVGVAVGSFTNTVIARNGELIVGLAEDLTLNLSDLYVQLRFVGGIEGWSLVSVNKVGQIVEVTGSGTGVPAGGTSGQVLAKIDAVDYNTEWVDQPGGAPGADGADGASAYEVAVDQGFVGTEAAWLASLVGPQGPAGADGADGAVGPQGLDGADGTDGINAVVTVGTTAPATPAVGDIWVDTN